MWGTVIVFFILLCYTCLFLNSPQPSVLPFHALQFALQFSEFRSFQQGDILCTGAQSVERGASYATR